MWWEGLLVGGSLWFATECAISARAHRSWWLERGIESCVKESFWCVLDVVAPGYSLELMQRWYPVPQFYPRPGVSTRPAAVPENLFGRAVEGSLRECLQSFRDHAGPSAVRDGELAHDVQKYGRAGVLARHNILAGSLGVDCHCWLCVGERGEPIRLEPGMRLVPLAPGEAKPVFTVESPSVTEARVRDSVQYLSANGRRYR